MSIPACPDLQDQIRAERFASLQIDLAVAKAVRLYLAAGVRWGDGTPEGWIANVAREYAYEFDPGRESREANRPKGKKAPKISSVLRGRVLERDSDTCQQCGATDDLTLDHVHPVSRGGDTSYENLRVLCRSCNSSKGAR